MKRIDGIIIYATLIWLLIVLYVTVLHVADDVDPRIDALETRVTAIEGASDE